MYTFRTTSPYCGVVVDDVVVAESEARITHRTSLDASRVDSSRIHSVYI